MMRAPTLAAIHEAEVRVAQSRANARNSLHRAGVAFRTTVVPARWALVAGGALFGFWAARWRRRKTSASARVSAAPAASAAGLLLGFIVRYAMQRLPIIVQLLWAARQNHGARAHADISNQPAPD